MRIGPLARFTMVWVILSVSAQGCDGCLLARIGYANPSILEWTFISAGWFIIQVGLIAYYKFWRKEDLSFILPAILLLFSLTIGRFLYLFYWPATLSLYPSLFFCLTLRPKNFKTRPRSLSYWTFGLGIGAILAYTGTYYYQAKRTTFAEHMLRYGGTSAIFFEMKRLKQREPASLETYREIVTKGKLVFLKDDRIADGQVMLMGQAASRLLAAGDPPRDAPLILDAMERVERDCADHGYIPNKNGSPDFAISLKLAFWRYFETQQQRPPVDLESKTAEWRKMWQKWSEENLKPQI